MGFDVTVRVRWLDFPLFLPVVTSSGLRDAAAVDKLVDDTDDFVLLSVVLLLVVVVLVVVGVVCCWSELVLRRFVFNRRV